jgi:hypothetical protein
MTCSTTRKGALGTMFGVHRSIRPRKCLRGSRIRSRRVRHIGSAGRIGAQVAAGRRPSAGRTGFSMLETIRQSPRNDSWSAAKHPRFGPPTRGTSPDGKPTSWTCGTAPGSARPTPGSPPNWPGFRCCPLRQWYEHDHRQRVDCRNPHQPSRLLNDADSRSPAEHRRHVTRPRPASPASPDRAQRSRRLAEVSTDGVSCNVGAARMSRQTSHHDP